MHDHLPHHILEIPQRVYKYGDSVGQETFTFFKDEMPIMTKGGICYISGMEGTRKTTLMMQLVAAALNPYSKHLGGWRMDLNADEWILYFDTEQPKTRFYKTLDRMTEISELSKPNRFYAVFQRGLSYVERKNEIDYVIKQFVKEGKKIGAIFVDGLADLVDDINNFKQASTVSNLVMKWTDMTDSMFFTAMHLTLGTDFVTGHLGRTLSKKADAGFMLALESDSNHTLVRQTKKREKPIPNFRFNQDLETGLPIIVNAEF